MIQARKKYGKNYDENKNLVICQKKSQETC